ncbi:MAG: hypothetical protein K2X47_15860 [Bdellovibrionales bacterium]|nr:hypothetical protein [Bdellovibrionales bacterium]
MNKRSTKTYIRKSIFLDPLEPEFVVKEGHQFCCENCTHFAPQAQVCTLGYNAQNHLLETQRKLYDMGGQVALCRFLEID